MPHIVVAPDSFKGSATSPEAAHAMAQGITDALGTQAHTTQLPMADGGEGTLDALLTAWHGTAHTVATQDANGRPTTARYAMHNTTAIIEAAQANGLPQVEDDLQPLRADSYGVGTIARAALDNGATEILLCIGGSASSDGGTGMLRALGAAFRDAHGHDVAPGAQHLADIRTIDTTNLRRARWRIAVDVTNPLLGPHGAAHTFGPQKGATPQDIDVIEAGLRNLTHVLDADPTSPGLGAAGGIPLTATALLNATPTPGAELVADTVGLDHHLATADLVITGEGRLDHQSLHGKVTSEIIQRTPKTTPIIVVAGQVALTPQQLAAAGITAAYALGTPDEPLDTLHAEALARIRATTARAIRATALFRNPHPAT